jgi:hypothetical protein
VVRRIFRNYAAGVSPRRIALALNAEGIPGPRGGVWAATAINGDRAKGTGVLNNERYIGRQVWGRRSWVRDPSTGRRLAGPRLGRCYRQGGAGAPHRPRRALASR